MGLTAGLFVGPHPYGDPMTEILLFHHAQGQTPGFLEFAERWRAAGHTVHTPDLYDGRTASDPEQAEALMEAMDSAKTGAKLDAAIADLRERTGGGPVGGLGFSMGGFRVLLQATTGAFDAVAVYYAALDAEQAASIHCPVLLHLAERDEFDPPEVFDQFVAGLRAAGTPVEAHRWPGTEHSFANADVALYAPTQAAEAWPITIRFLRDHLGSP